MPPTGLMRVFVSYSHKDERWLNELRRHMAPHRPRLDMWDDTRIPAGERWRDKIETALGQAQVAVLLVSDDFLASRFITQHELPALLKAAERAGLRVLVLHASASALAHEPTLSDDHETLKTFQALNDPRRPLAALKPEPRRAALSSIAAAIAAHAQTPPDESAAQDERAYLERLRDETRRLELRGLRAERAEQLDLEQVYTRLRVAGSTQCEERDTASGARPELGDAGRDRELHELLSDHACLALVGAPGSGKSTFLQFVALNLARAGLGEDRAACLERLGWFGDPPLPIPVRLADFARFLEAPGEAALPGDCAELFYRFLDQPAPWLPSHLPATFRRRRLAGGGCMLLLDGLDEVPGDDTRTRVSAIIGEVVADGRRAGNRHVVTCRTRAYEGRTRLGAEFTRAMLVDFGEAEVATFVRQWSRALFTGQPAEASDAHGRDLMAAIRAHPNVRPLTRNPLLLTILAVVHWDRKQMPEQRADLYESAVDRLLDTRREGESDVIARRHALQAVALRFFNDPAGVRKTLDRHEAAAAAALALDTDVETADRYLAVEELRSGLLVSRREGEVEFSHLTFGEFLAALDLAWRGADGWAILRTHVFDPAWSEVVLLLAGCLWKRGPGLVPKLIDNILAEGRALSDRAKQVGLIDRILRDVRVRADGRDPSARTGYAVALQEALAVFEPGSAVPESVRIELGEALGQAGDPRLRDDDHEDRVFIEGGTFLMGSQEVTGAVLKDARPVHRVTLSAFWIDRCPVTVVRYRRFVEAGAEGYLAPRFWSTDGWYWRNSFRRTAPRLWQDQLPHANRPVVGVSWYEAQAYCAWLSAQSGRRVALPTEAQWEYAARGADGRRCPWGDTEATDRHMNFNGRIGYPTPVGIYPLGATPEGVQDLLGNVWEWCSDWYGPYESADSSDPVGASNGTCRVLRGGGFNLDAWLCRAVHRNYGHPESVGDIVGFRCVVTASGEQID